ncbi:uncharacterized protein LOC131930251 [Physella acuta]|uniref:uncharacterized protein LOC131930251 n=1 Tax=Physella acuta TaxID=109671 RepID=UPI0027DE63BE|nr:uncharacterized protein LOC131930251 [Physella acuta]XP_059142645.1 uncharacterized protein LOC131930251 [Physella acuta]
MVSVGATTTTPTTSNGISVSDITTELDDQAKVPVRQVIQVEEFVIVLIIVIFWLFAVMAFLKKWDSIRIMQPMEPRYKHNPKNLESIKIVKRAQDSVIYKNYSRKMSTTMVAREKRRLQRMHTVPCMSALPAIHLDRLPTIQMEVTTEM